MKRWKEQQSYWKERWKSYSIKYFFTYVKNNSGNLENNLKYFRGAFRTQANNQDGAFSQK